MLMPDVTLQEFPYYLEALRNNHERHISADLIRRSDESLVGPLDMWLLDGQVTVNCTGDQATTRILNLSFLDLARSVAFQPGPGGRKAHQQFLIRIGYGVRVPKLGRWVEVPVFKGPIYDVDRDGAQVNIVARGMEEVAKNNIGRVWTLPKGGVKTKQAKDLLAATGLDGTRVRIPNLMATFPDRKTLKYDAIFWDEVVKIARSLGYYMFPDGAGNVWWRKLGYRPVLTFDRELLEDPKPSESGDDLNNVFRVFGADPKGPADRLSYTAYFPEDDPNSMQSLAHHGHWARRILTEENEHLKTQKAVRRHAIELRDEALRKVTAQELAILPIPILEEWDMVASAGQDGPRNTRATQFAIPLGGSDVGGSEGTAMTVGSVRRLTQTPRFHGAAA